MLSPYRTDGSVNVVIESPRGSCAKFKYDAQDNIIRLSRPLPAGLAYPYDWGYVAGTRAPDGDPVDAMVLWDGASYPAVVVPARPIGVLRVEETEVETGRRERNDRLLTVAVKAPRWNTLANVLELDSRLRAELEQFFAAAVAFEGKDLQLLGWGDAREADALIRTSSTRHSAPDE